MSDKSITQSLYTADPTIAPIAGESFSYLKSDLNGALWIRPIATLAGGAGIQTSRDPDNDGIDPAVEDIVAFDVAAFNYIWDATNSVWDRERRFQAADNMPTPEARQVLSYLFGYDGTNWDMLRTIVDNADNNAPDVTGLLAVVSRLQAFNGTNWDRLKAAANNTDAHGSITGLLQVASTLYAYNGATFDRVRSMASDSDTISTSTLGLIASLAHSMVFNGTNWQRDYKSANFNANTNSNVGVASASILAASITRKSLLIQNHDTTNSIYINFGAAATTSDLEIIPGGNYEPLIVPTDEIFAIADAVATTYTIVSA